jgi:hypothetical protein
MKLRLNLATSPPANNRPFLAGATLAGVIAVLALALLSHAAYRSWQANRELRADTASVEDKIQADQRTEEQLDAYFKGPAALQVLGRAAFLNSLIDERSFPWTRVFMDLEQTLPPGVRVVSISPKLINGRAEVTLQVGASSDETKIQFLQSIEKSKMFSGMVVKDERRSDSTATSDKITLNLTVWYTIT